MKDNFLANVKCDHSPEKALGETPKNSSGFQDPNKEGNIQLAYVRLEFLAHLAK